MSDDPLSAILDAQNSVWNGSLPKLVHRPALPSLAPKTTPSALERNDLIDTSRPATSRPPTTSIGFPPLPKLRLPPMQPLHEKPKTPIYPIPRSNISYALNLNDIDDDEILRPDSVASTEMGSYRREQLIKRELRIPPTFSEFREVSVDLDQINSDDIDKMLNGCRAVDHRNTGVLSLQAVLHSIRNVHPSDTWQHLLDWMMALSLEENEKEEQGNTVFLLDYHMFFEVLQNDKQSREVLINIPEVLESDDSGSVFSHRPTSSQEQRERWRVKLLMDLELILSTNPDIDIERFKNATDKKIITVDELKMLLQIYGLTDHIHDLEQRIIDCFLTSDHLFSFSAFIGCLNQINPAVLNPSSPQILPKSAPWSKSPLRKFDDSGFIPDLDATTNGSKPSTSHQYTG
uniref:EF-hand domain-containing protein n=1 Tax=Caenorhabditis japonica TaxID=281687 RepID=A0A8R1DG82_CAEJA